MCVFVCVCVRVCVCVSAGACVHVLSDAALTVFNQHTMINSPDGPVKCVYTQYDSHSPFFQVTSDFCLFIQLQSGGAEWGSRRAEGPHHPGAPNLGAFKDATT